MEKVPLKGGKLEIQVWSITTRTPMMSNGLVPTVVWRLVAGQVTTLFQSVQSRGSPVREGVHVRLACDLLTRGVGVVDLDPLEHIDVRDEVTREPFDHRTVGIDVVAGEGGDTGPFASCLRCTEDVAEGDTELENPDQDQEQDGHDDGHLDQRCALLHLRSVCGVSSSHWYDYVVSVGSQAVRRRGSLSAHSKGLAM